MTGGSGRFCLSFFGCFYLLLFCAIATHFTKVGAISRFESNSGSCTRSVGVSCNTGNLKQALLERTSVLSTRGGGELENSALVFIKPHAHTAAVIDYVKERLLECGMEIVEERVIMPTSQMVDNHYFAISSNALQTNDYDSFLDADKKKNIQYDPNLVYSASRACEELFDGDEKLLSQYWNDEDVTQIFKIKSGLYCGRMELIDIKDNNKKRVVYVMNGFYIPMKSALVSASEGVYAMYVRWNPSDLSWKDFRFQLVGSTDPTKAHSSSMRRYIYENYKSLNLQDQPNTSLNGIHASASPLEAHVELNNWFSHPPKSWTKACQQSGLLNTPFYTQSMTNSDIFDEVEDLDAPACLEKLLLLQQQQNN